MPEDIPGGDISACMDIMQEQGHDEEAAAKICESLSQEAKADNGNVDALRQALERGRGLIADVGVDFNSAVETPAVDSKWVMMKSDAEDHNRKLSVPILVKQTDTEKRISYAPAMIPREPDKEGDVVPTPVVESAAHGYLENDGEVDTDHNLIDGKGTVVESWIEPAEREWDLPDGGTETYPAGTWMVGIKWGQETWDRIKAGELSGLSIYGMAEHIPLGKACGCTAKQPEDDPCWEGYEMVGTKTDEFGNEVPNCVPVEEASAKRDAIKQLDIPLATESVVHLVYESRTAAEKASEEIGLDGAVHEHEFDGMTVWMPGETHEAFVDTYMDLSEDAAELSATKSETTDSGKSQAPDSDTMGDNPDDDPGGDDAGTEGGGGDGPTLKDVTEAITEVQNSVSTLKEAVETDKQGAEEAAAMLAEEYDMNPGDLLDVVEAAEDYDPQMVVEAIQSIEAEESDEEDDEEMEMDAGADDGAGEATEKQTGQANLAKGHTGDGVRQAQAEERTGKSGGTGNIPSYAEAAEQHEAGD